MLTCSKSHVLKRFFHEKYDMEPVDKNATKERSQIQQHFSKCEDSGFGNRDEVCTETVAHEINDEIESSRGSERKPTDSFFDEKRKLSHEEEMCNQPTGNENIVPSGKNLVPTPQQCQDQMRAILRDRYDFTPKVIRSSSEFENLLNTLIYVHGITETIRVQNGLHLFSVLKQEIVNQTVSLSLKQLIILKFIGTVRVAEKIKEMRPKKRSG